MPLPVLKVPLSEDLLNYYRQRLERADQDYDDALNRIDILKIAQEDYHRSQWELLKREAEIAELQNLLSDHRERAFDERKQLLKIMAENDHLKVMELKDRKKIRYLLSVSGNSPSEITYFRDLIDKRLVRIHQTGENKNSSKSSKENHQERDIVILEDEIEGLKLNLTAVQTQLDEQRTFYEQTISQLKRDRELSSQEHKVWLEQSKQKSAELLESNRRLRTLCRENTRELLFTKKSVHNYERQLIEEKTVLFEENVDLKKKLETEVHKSQSIEKTVEAKITRKHDSIISDLKSRNIKLEESLNIAKMRNEDVGAQYQRKIDQLQSRSDAALSNLNSLKKRRDFEIEGFTNDIILLRKQLKTLERSILKYAPLEDKELVLLGMAQATGQKVAHMSTTLQGLKAKVYQTEMHMKSFASV
ncbi:Coiled-coil domain-containing protein 77 [Nowakowskiella sp. JEL0078]|nr:Coiled-coil domain-containing protein 77 [Nowakowskiella sp. JEL0078]